MTIVVLRPTIGVTEFPTLVRIWRRAVDATHGFVAPQDLDEIEELMASTYLPSVELTVAEVNGRPVGFAGTAHDRLEMLFVDDAFRGCGVGSALLEHAVMTLGITDLEVNEQNPEAFAFYVNRGFEIVGRRESDDAGRPYPLLHLRRRT